MTPPDDATRSLLAEMLGAIPKGVVYARIYIPEKPGEDAVLEYDGKKFYFPPKTSGSSDCSQVMTPTASDPSDAKSCE